MSDTDPRFMKVALDIARRGLLAGEPPIGACLVRDGELVAVAHNGVVGELDITAHAELRVIRQACRQLRTLELSGCTLYSTVEPCCMCLTAGHYAGVSRVVYGASLRDMDALTSAELMLTHEVVLKHSRRRPAIAGGVLGDDCRALLAEWAGTRG